MERNRVTGVVIATKRGLMTIRAKAVVDCTGRCRRGLLRRGGDHDGARHAHAHDAVAGADQYRHAPGHGRPTSWRPCAAARKKYPLITSGFLEIEQTRQQHQLVDQSRGHGGHGPRGRHRSGGAHQGRVHQPASGAPDGSGRARVGEPGAAAASSGWHPGRRSACARPAASRACTSSPRRTP